MGARGRCSRSRGRRACGGRCGRAPRLPLLLLLLLLLLLVLLSAGWRSGVAAVAVAMAAEAPLAPRWALEPPPRLLWGSRGASASCAARGHPPPQLSWTTADGAPLVAHHTDHGHDRRMVVLANGTLELGPLPPGGEGGGGGEGSPGGGAPLVVRCRAANAHGAIVSRDMHVHTVGREAWAASVVMGGRAAGWVSGGPALLACSVPAAVRARASVQAWYRDDRLLPIDDDLEGGAVLVDGGWQLVLLVVTRAKDEGATFACAVLDSATGERKRSAPLRLAVAEALPPGPPRALLPPAGAWQASAWRGEDVLIPCLVYANPPATITWHRLAPGAGGEGELPLQGGRWSWVGDALVLRLRRAEAGTGGDGGDGGALWCRADNGRGRLELRAQLSVRAPLQLTLHPHTQTVDVGGSGAWNCSWTGWPPPRVEWLHDGAPLAAPLAAGRVQLSPAGDQLVIERVQRGDAGVYQCVVRNSEGDSAAAGGELRLGQAPPELRDTFIEQVLRPGQLVALRCAAEGKPPPLFAWLLDAQPLDAAAMGPRFSVEQWPVVADGGGGEVVSFVNISAARAADGGLYTCRATNAKGHAQHTARLNIYGPPYVRSVAPVRAVAGRELVLPCPYSGYPISSVRWERNGVPVEGSSPLSSDALGVLGVLGVLRIERVQASHAGAYTCVVSGAHGQSARRDLQLTVSNPPEIEAFSFGANVVAGRRAQVSCSVTAGDMPVHFAWLKDGAPIPPDLQVEERGAEFFSNLVFREVWGRHQGRYTCVASNAAAEANHSAVLAVKVPPQWVEGGRPADAVVLAGEPLALHCAATGSPQPEVRWLRLLRGSGGAAEEPVPAAEGPGAAVAVLSNGSLLVRAASAADAGRYSCRADNGVPPALQHAAHVTVREPARFERPAANVTARLGEPASLACHARGDAPLSLTWARADRPLDLDSYRVSVSEAATAGGLRSQLRLSRADRADAGAYRCRAANAHGHQDQHIYLSVQERPEAPVGLAVTALWSRGARLSWAAGYDGGAPLEGFALQAAPLATPLAAPHAAQWDTVPVLNISVHESAHPHVTLTRKGSVHFEAQLSHLRPHTAYMLRVAAYNAIARSDYTEPVVLKTREEAPSEPPTLVGLAPGAAGELLASWRPPPRAAWHGELLGYAVTCRRLEGMDGAEADENATAATAPLTLVVNGWAANELTLSGLRPFSRYEVRVRAFNGVAAGPPSPPLHATTREGVPSGAPQRVACSALSPSSLQVSWAPPPPGTRGGIIQGYKVLYTPLTADYAEVDVGETKRVTATNTYLHSLRKYTNYSIQVLAFTNAGDGKRSPAIYCITEEDVPSAPQKIKALALSGEAVLVSWLPPLSPNGLVTHYTVYYREAGRLGKHSSVTVPVQQHQQQQHQQQQVGPGGAMELMGRVAGLREGQPYEWWVAASGARGEGPATPVVGQAPNAREGARIASFGRVLALPLGAGAARLPCVAAGAPAPRTRWTHGPLRQPVTHHPHYRVDRQGHLLITQVNEQSAGNFTCTASNSLGEDAIVHEVRVLRAPGTPSLALRHATASSLSLRWTPPAPAEPLLGYRLQHQEASQGAWQEVELPPDATGHTLEMLKCGTAYRVQVCAWNRIATGPPSDTLAVATRGGRPRPPRPEEHAAANATAIRVHLYLWRDGGCPIVGFRVSYRRAGAARWAQAGGGTGEMALGALEIGGLAPGAWYEVAVEAASAAGPSTAALLVDTRTEAGARIGPRAPPAAEGAEGGTRAARGSPWPWPWAGGAALALGGAGGLAALALRWRRRWASALSDSNGPEREKLRDNHKLYSSSSIAHNDKSLDDASELYEISPYATFGVAGVGGASGASGASGVGGVSLSYRTLARREDDAAPPHPQPQSQRRRRRGCDHYRYDESSLSQCSTVEVRHRARAAAAGAALGPRGPEAAGRWHQRARSRSRSRSDSDENSDSAANTTTKGSGSPAGSVYGSGSGRRSARPAASSASSGGSGGNVVPRPKGLPPAAPSHPPPAPADISSLIDKYQQRKEQERRECTIHV